MFTQTSMARAPGRGRIMAIVALMTVAMAVPLASQASADDDRKGYRGDKKHHGNGGYHGNGYDRPHWQRWQQPPQRYYYREPPVIYAPPPVYYGQPPGVSLNFLFPFYR